jgi:hypothetical protein
MLAEANFNNSIISALRENDYGTASALSSRVDLFLGFITLAILLVFSLLIAKQMGAYGADAAIKHGNSIIKSVQGYVGSSAARAGWRVAGGIAGAGPVPATLGRIPLVNRAIGTAIQKGAQASQYRAQQEAKKVKGLDPRSQARVFSTLSTGGQAAAMKNMDTKQRGEIFRELHKVSDSAPKRIARNLEQQGVIDRRESEALVGIGGNIHEAMQNIYPEYRAGFGMPPPKYEEDGVTETEAGKKYYSRIEDFMRGLTSEEKTQINVLNQLKGGNPYFEDYFLKNAENLNDFTKNRADIEFGNEFLAKILQRAIDKEGKLLSDDEFSEFIKRDYGNEKLADLFKKKNKSNIGFMMMTEPALVKVHQPAEKTETDKKLDELIAASKNQGGSTSQPT